MQQTKTFVYIKPTIYSFIKSIVTDEKSFHEIIQEPKDIILFLISQRIFDNPELLENVVFELETQEEVLITKNSICDLKNNCKMKLIRLYDQKEIVLEPSEFKEQFAQSEVFDYIEKDEK